MNFLLGIAGIALSLFSFFLLAGIGFAFLFASESTINSMAEAFLFCYLLAIAINIYGFMQCRNPDQHLANYGSMI